MRKRRTKYTWLPVIGADELDDTFISSKFARRLTIPAGSRLSTLDYFPVIGDVPDDTVDGAKQLVDYVGSSLFLKRIVGKCFATTSQDNSGAGVKIDCVGLTAGFFIARADPSTGLPVGLTDGANIADFRNYSPIAEETQREPWIWRRTWLLGNNAAPVQGGGDFQPGQFFPATNAARSVLDGPHIDAKTARRTQQDERLWFAASAWSALDAVGAEDTNVDIVLDCRYLGAVRRQRNRSAF